MLIPRWPVCVPVRAVAHPSGLPAITDSFADQHVAFRTVVAAAFARTALVPAWGTGTAVGRLHFFHVHEAERVGPSRLQLGVGSAVRRSSTHRAAGVSCCST